MATSMPARCAVVCVMSSPGTEIDQREACRRIAASLQLRGCFDEHDLERRTNTRLNQMTAVRRPVAPPDHDVRVQRRTVVTSGHVADKRDHLDLLLNLDPSVVALLQFEVAERHALERADAG